MSLIDLGRKPSKAESTNQIYYPSFYIDNKDVPIRGQDVGKTIMATVKLKIKSIEARTSDKGGSKYSCSFDVLAIDFAKKKVDIKNTSKSDLDEAERLEYERFKK